MTIRPPPHTTYDCIEICETRWDNCPHDCLLCTQNYKYVVLFAGSCICESKSLALFWFYVIFFLLILAEGLSLETKGQNLRLSCKRLISLTIRIWRQTNRRRARKSPSSFTIILLVYKLVGNSSYSLCSARIEDHKLKMPPPFPLHQLLHRCAVFVLFDCKLPEVSREVRRWTLLIGGWRLVFM